MLDVTLVVVLGVAAAGVAADVVSNMAAEWRGSGCERGGWEFRGGAVCRLSSVCHCFRGVWGWFDTVERFAVAVVDAVVKDDVAGNGGGRGLVSTALGVV